jgi:phosphonoacetate hydrolase
VSESVRVVNGRGYRRPSGPTAVVCLDGVDPRYLDDALERRLVPRIAELVEQGAYLRGQSQLPSFTNPNNLSIVTGAPPSVHGISGNHYLAPDGRDVQLTEPELLRAPSIHAELQRDGVRVLAVTTKEKLRPMLANGEVRCVSAERADEQELPGLDGPVAALVARPKPGIYDWDCSHFALELGLALGGLLEIELLYVSLTDFVQHAAAPGEELSDRYLRELDRIVGLYLEAGWQLGLVADHGMNAKSLPDGRPNIRFLADVLAADGLDVARVILPITDPYVVHHASLGSACWVYVDEERRDQVRDVLLEVDGVEEVLTRDEAVPAFSLPGDRIGDLVVLGAADTALGGHAAEHDLSQLHGALRSHGGRHERAVPILLSEPPAVEPPADLSNADVHHLLLGEAA